MCYNNAISIFLCTLFIFTIQKQATGEKKKQPVIKPFSICVLRNRQS